MPSRFRMPADDHRDPLAAVAHPVGPSIADCNAFCRNSSRLVVDAEVGPCDGAGTGDIWTTLRDNRIFPTNAPPYRVVVAPAMPTVIVGRG